MRLSELNFVTHGDVEVYVIINKHERKYLGTDYDKRTYNNCEVINLYPNDGNSIIVEVENQN